MENAAENIDIPKGMKKCKVCGALIAKNAKQCPKCGARNKKPFYLRGWFIILCIIILLIGFLRIRTILNPPMSYEALKEKAITVDLKSLAMEYAKNAGAFKDKYKDKCIQVTGIVDVIDSSGSLLNCQLVWTQETHNTFPAGWGNDDEMLDAVCYSITPLFVDNEVYKNLTRGQTITVIGVFDGTNALHNAYIVP